jgi:glutathione S-transferase
MPDETTRAEVAQALAEQLGPRISAALMEVIPPFGWHEIATKSDLLALEKRLDSRFDVVDSRFDVVDVRFTAVDRRFDAMESRFDAIDARFDAIDARFDAIDARFDAMGARFNAMDARFNAMDSAAEARFVAVDDRFDAMRAELLGAMHQEGARLLRWMVTAMIATATAIGGIVAAVGALT